MSDPIELAQAAQALAVSWDVLSLDQRTFLDYYLGQAGGNGMKAVKLMFPGATPAQCSIQAIEFLRSLEVSACLAAVDGLDSEILTLRESRRILSKIAKGEAVDPERPVTPQVQIQAIETLHRLGSDHGPAGANVQAGGANVQIVFLDNGRTKHQ